MTVRPRLAIALVAIAVLLAAGPASGSAERQPASSAVGRGIYLGCPSPPGAPYGIRVWVHVVKWCGNEAVRRQAQLKLQVSIENTGHSRLDISRPHLRLIVTQFARNAWSPPRVGDDTVDRPFRTTYQGRQVWAIPPNADGAYDFVPGRPGFRTFATHWGAESLQPGKTFHPIDRQRGSVVFYLPRDPHHSDRLDGVLGLAYVDGRDIVVLCPPERWGPRVSENDF